MKKRPLFSKVAIVAAVSLACHTMIGCFLLPFPSGNSPAVDTTAPMITLLGDATMNLIVGDPFIDPGATATDDTDGNITADIIVSGDVVDTGTAGSYTIRYNVSDQAGNAAIEVTREIVVNAVTASVGGTITLPGAANGASYEILLSEDGYGFVVEDSVQATAGAETAIDYALSAAPGNYYLRCIVDIDSSGPGSVTGGDFMAYYGGDGFAAPLSANVVVTDTTPVTVDFVLLEAVSVTGTVTLPATAEGAQFGMAIGITGGVLQSGATGVVGAGTTVVYVLAAPAGTYEVWCIVDVDSSGFGALTAGDYFGYYGGTGLSAPALPNAVVPASGAVIFDFPIVEF